MRGQNKSDSYSGIKNNPRQDQVKRRTLLLYKLEKLEAKLKKERDINNKIEKESNILRQKIEKLDTNKLLEEPRRARRLTPLVKDWEIWRGKESSSTMPLGVKHNISRTQLCRERESMYVSLSYTRSEKTKEKNVENKSQ